MKTINMRWVAAGIALVIGGAVFAELMDRGHEPIAGVVLALVLGSAGYGAWRAWQQGAWLPLGVMLVTPVSGVVLWMAVALQEALKAA
ncbi:hypothetical protein FXN63_00680 [Pigmentiphaga aceris]|uniref:Uncharacterized protein n=1 Tax=Pigmentiphaga aceris TaxID=1940612 RepID=A0A5C0AR23_9BURK|nr:hypothetical protein [Pigmentiphaga aceris]QEI04508.1 hypothetical protein FXN63_00680 [Pigmentiphaga aceris]